MRQEYDTYKDSGVEWIGKVPSHWKIRKGKYCTKIIAGYPFDSNKFTDEEGFIGLIRIRDINSSITEVNYKGAYPSESIITKGDILVGMDGDFNIAEWSGADALLNQRVCKVGNTKELNSKFAYYFLPQTLKSINDVTYATTVKHLSTYDITNAIFVFPTLDEQETIAGWLDKKCGEIDKVIEGEKRRIGLLEELKQSVITEAVTHGLNPDAPLRPSGVDWIGNIPAHWERSKMKNCIAITNGSDPKTEGNIPVYGSGASSFKTCGEYKEGPTVLIGRKGATLHIPSWIEGKYWNVDTAFDTRVKDNFNLRYFYYIAVIFDYKKYISQTTLPSMTQFDYGNAYIPLPPLSEQQAIVAYLDEKCGAIDGDIAKTRRKIELLQEYKQSLITEVVTGKRKVV